MRARGAPRGSRPPSGAPGYGAASGAVWPRGSRGRGPRSSRRRSRGASPPGPRPCAGSRASVLPGGDVRRVVLRGEKARELRRIGHAHPDHPALAVGRGADPLEVFDEFAVHLDDVSAHRRYEVAHGLRGLDLAEAGVLLHGGAFFREIDEGEVAELVDGVVRDADDRDVSLDADPLVSGGVLQLGRSRHGLTLLLLTPLLTPSRSLSRSPSRCLSLPPLFCSIGPGILLRPLPRPRVERKGYRDDRLEVPPHVGGEPRTGRLVEAGVQVPHGDGVPQRGGGSPARDRPDGGPELGVLLLAPGEKDEVHAVARDALPLDAETPELLPRPGGLPRREGVLPDEARLLELHREPEPSLEGIRAEVDVVSVEGHARLEA